MNNIIKVTMFVSALVLGINNLAMAQNASAQQMPGRSTNNHMRNMPHHMDRMHERPMRADYQQLNLTEEQKLQIENIRKESKARADALRQEMDNIRRENEERIMSVLTDEQKEIYQSLKHRSERHAMYPDGMMNQN